ncbi:MAG: PAS domain-containing protein [Methylophilaceae bacterium]|nr:PAS domain-containing protein [Methylophilaceae bacterium]
MCISRLNDIVLITEAKPLNSAGHRIVYVNDAFERRTGYKREEVIGKTLKILQGEKKDRQELNRIRLALEKWQPVRAELINYTKSGKEVWLELDIVAIANETVGTPIGSL